MKPTEGRRTLYDAFKERFESELLSSTSNRQAFDRAAEFFESILSYKPYTYDSWRALRSRKKSNKNVNNINTAIDR